MQSSSPRVIAPLALAAYVAAGVAGTVLLASSRRPDAVLLALVGGGIAAVNYRNTWFWVFASALVLAANEWYVAGIAGIFTQVRWVPLFYLVVLVALRIAATRSLPRRFRLIDAYCCAWLALAVASAGWSIAPGLTAGRAGTLVLMYLAVFWGVWAFVDRAGEERCVTALLGSAAVVMAASWLLLLAGRAVFWGGRFRGAMGNPNALGWVCGFTIPLALHRALSRGRRGDWALVAVLGASLLLSASRGALVATTVSTAYLLWQARSRYFWILVVAGMWVGLSFANVTPMPARFQEYARVEHLATGSGRLEAWPIAVGLIRERAAVGYGFGTEDLHLSADLYDFQEFEGGYFHNSFLGLTLQVGLVGSLAFFLPLLWGLVSGVRRSLRRDGLDLVHAYQSILLVGLLACLFESWIYSMGNSFAFLFWVPAMMLARRASGGAAEPAGAPVPAPSAPPAWAARAPVPLAR